MTDNTQPEALRLADDIHRWNNPCAKAAAELRRQHTRIAELEAQLEAVGAGGVQALSAAQAGWRELAAKVMDALADAQDTTNSQYPEHVRCYPSWERHARWLRWHADMFRSGNPVGNGAGNPDVLAALAASPTPPAEQAAPKAAPGEQNTVPAEWLEQAYREGWAACRDAETIGEEAEDWAFGNSTANSRMIDAQQAAPQQEAQPTEIPQVIERMATDRYKVVPSHESMFHRWAVVAGSGTQQLYLGREVECQNMARKFAGAFLDGAFVTMQSTSPNPAPAPLSDREEIAMVDAAMVEMANIVPPLKRSECARLIRAAVAAQGGKV